MHLATGWHRVPMDQDRSDTRRAYLVTSASARMHVLFRCMATNIRDCDLICFHLSARDISMSIIISVAAIVSVLGPWIEVFGRTQCTQINIFLL